MKTRNFMIFGALSLVAACSLLLDPDATQCRSNADCARFSGAICDANAKLCIAANGAPPRGGGGGSRSEDPGQGGADAGTMPGASRCNKPNKPLVTLEGEIASSALLDCDKEYLLVGTVLVKAGATLTIAPGTTIRGNKDSQGTLVVQPGGRLLAVGSPSEPIVFTSEFGEKIRRPGDWGGVIMLGKAPVNTGTGKVEGITEGGEYGGNDVADSSGTLKYVRIEYSGISLGPNNEINGLTLAGVGSGTIIDYVQVRMTTDDCFEFFGGTVNAKHLVCQSNGDDGFDWDLGYRGKLQYLVLQQDPSVVDETNGFEGDSNANSLPTPPISAPTIYNATLCGKGLEVDKQQYGLLLRKATAGIFRNLIVSGFEAGVDIRDSDSPSVDISSSIFFGNLVKNLAYEEDGSDNGVQKDDDKGFNENAWLLSTTSISTADPQIGCFDRNVLRLAPKVALAGAVPPADGFFDATAAFIGAFRDGTDTWASGAWLVWQDR